jgi:hypothetical protein
MSRAGHGSVRAGFSPFGHPTRDLRVLNFSIRKSQEKMKNRRVFGRLGSGFFFFFFFFFWSGGSGIFR